MTLIAFLLTWLVLGWLVGWGLHSRSIEGED